ncbi:alpha/beta fold hydrolase [Ornithinibacillus sp. 4-3]|uniref:Alpha/beta fold hydrolase n=1 Tax=Ornithinibacillus sp. 4-3 TaxID=3231488 RepID=A0AB39HRQ6_9BACI
MDNKILAYMNLNTAYRPRAIPKSGRFTFLSKVSGMPQVWTLDKDNKPIPYAEFDDTVIGVYHSPNGDMSVVGKDNNGNEKVQLYLLLKDGQETETLVESPEHFHDFGGWSPDGKYIAFSSNRRHPGFFDVFIQNVITKEITKVFENDDICSPVTWLPDGEHLLIDIPENSLDQNLFKLNIKTGETIKVGEKDVPARYQSFTFTKDKQAGYVLTDLNEEMMYISKFSLNNLNSFEKVVHVSEWDIEEFKLFSNQQKMVYTINEGGIYKLCIFDLNTQENKEIEGLPKGVIDSIAWVSEDEFVFGVNTPTCPGDIWKYTLSNDQVERLTYISHSEEVTLTEPKICTYRSFDGLEVPYFYYEKKQSENKSALLYVHGGPTVQTRAEYNYYIQYLVDQGFAVAAPNVRGSSGYGRTYMGLDDVRNRMDSVKDLVSLVDDLVKTHKVNPHKVGIMGRSYGGFMVNAAISHYPDLWGAAASIVGISSFKTFMNTTGHWRRKLRGSEYGTIEEDLAFFEEIDPLLHSHKIKAPLLVFHGLNDSRVPVTESIQLVMAMKERRQDVGLTIFENEGHFTEKIENHIKMHGNIVKFMEKHLLD